MLTRPLQNKMPKNRTRIRKSIGQKQGEAQLIQKMSACISQIEQLLTEEPSDEELTDLSKALCNLSASSACINAKERLRVGEGIASLSRVINKERCKKYWDEFIKDQRSRAKLKPVLGHIPIKKYWGWLTRWHQHIKSIKKCWGRLTRWHQHIEFIKSVLGHITRWHQHIKFMKTDPKDLRSTTPWGFGTKIFKVEIEKII